MQLDDNIENEIKELLGVKLGKGTVWCFVLSEDNRWEKENWIVLIS